MPSSISLVNFRTIKVILDPIMGDHGVYYTNFDESYGAAMWKILPYADIILPNLTEMYLLAGKEYQLTGNHRNVLHLCEILRELGAKNMIITSVPKDDCKKGIVLYEDNAFLYIGNGENLKEFHGAGDAFDGMFLAKLLQGNSLWKVYRLRMRLFVPVSEKAKSMTIRNGKAF